MLNVTVRPAKPNDIPALAQLWLEKMVLVAQSDSRFKLLPDAADQWSGKGDRHGAREGESEGQLNARLRATIGPDLRGRNDHGRAADAHYGDDT